MSEAQVVLEVSPPPLFSQPPPKGIILSISPDWKLNLTETRSTKVNQSVTSHNKCAVFMIIGLDVQPHRVMAPWADCAQEG